MKGYKIKITLSKSKPTIYRHVIIPEKLTFKQLHLIIQLSMGWDNYHLYDFYIPQKNILMTEGKPMISGFGNLRYLSVNKQINQFLNKDTKMVYTYDMGDNWEHEIRLMRELESEEPIIPKVIKWQGNCPPEDCGGIYSYQNLLYVLEDPEHEEYEDVTNMLEEIGYNEMSAFSLEDTNTELKNLFYR